MKTFKLSSFPQDDRIWRVDWFGGVQFNPSNPSEPQIEVLVSPLKPGGIENPSANKFVDYKSQRLIYVGVGQLALIYVGTLWKKGQQVYEATAPYSKTTLKNLEINQDKMKIITTGYNENNHYIIPSNYYMIGHSSGLKSKCLCIENDNDQHGIIIPMMEVIRFYYVQSSTLTKILFNGSFWQDSDAIYNIEKSAITDDGLGIIRLRTKIKDNDAWLAARIAFSKVAKNNALKIYTSMIKNRMNLDPNIAIPETYPPFEGLTNLKVIGKKILSGSSETDKKWRFLVFCINSCSAPFPFKDLTATRDNDATKPQFSDNIRKPSTWKSKKKKNMGPDDEEEVTDNESADQNEEMNDVLLTKNRFSCLIGKKLKKVEKLYSEYKHDPTILNLIKSDNKKFSTGDTTYSDTQVSPLDFSIDDTNMEYPGSEREKAMDASFENFIDGLNVLTTKGDISYKIIPGSYKSVSTKYGPASLFPHYYISKPLPFSYLGYRGVEKRVPRKVLIAEITFGKYYFYLMEIQHMPNDKFMTLFSYNHYFSQFKLYDLRIILLHCAKNSGKWFKEGEIPNIIRDAFKHPTSPENFALKALKKMHNALSY